jgi:hypothetical protein
MPGDDVCFFFEVQGTARRSRETTRALERKRVGMNRRSPDQMQSFLEGGRKRPRIGRGFVLPGQDLLFLLYGFEAFNSQSLFICLNTAHRPSPVKTFKNVRKSLTEGRTMPMMTKVTSSGLEVTGVTAHNAERFGTSSQELQELLVLA